MKIIEIFLRNKLIFFVFVVIFVISIDYDPLPKGLVMVSNCVICGRFFSKGHGQKKTCNDKCAKKLRYKHTNFWRKKPENRKKINLTQNNWYHNKINNVEYVNNRKEYYHKRKVQDGYLERKRELARKSYQRLMKDTEYRKRVNEQHRKNMQIRMSNAEYRKQINKKSWELELKRREDPTYRKHKNNKSSQRRQVRKNDPMYRKLIYEQNKLLKQTDKYREKERIRLQKPDNYKKRIEWRMKYRKKTSEQKRETESLAVIMAALTQPKLNKE